MWESNEFKHLKDLKYSENFRPGPKGVDILIGLDFYYKLVSSGPIMGNADIVAVKTKLGYVLAGKATATKSNSIHSFIATNAFRVGSENVDERLM